MTIEELYAERAAGRGAFPDIVDHLPTLRRYAEQLSESLLCPARIVEFGTRTGNTTTAFLAGGAEVLSFDINDCAFDCPAEVRPRWNFVQADTANLVKIPVCDMLFIDSAHNEAQVRAELRMHVHVNRFIGLHDTIEWGTKADDGKEGPGINYALFPFLAEQNKVWRVAAHWNHCRGLTVLERIS